MKKLLVSLTAVLSMFLCTITTVDAQENETANGISEEAKDFMNTQEYRDRIEKKREWLAKQPALRRSAGRMDVPHYVQEEPTWCGPASVQMIIEYVTGDKLRQSDLADELRTDVGKVGTYVDDVASVLASYTGAPYEVGSVNYGNFYANVKADFDADYPVVYDVDAALLDSYYTDPTPHFIVGAGYSSSGSLYYSDPGKNSGYNRSASQSAMIDALEGNGGYYVY